MGSYGDPRSKTTTSYGEMNSQQETPVRETAGKLSRGKLFSPRLGGGRILKCNMGNKCNKALFARGFSGFESAT
jgi:hypothetical protein